MLLSEKFEILKRVGAIEEMSWQATVNKLLEEIQRLDLALFKAETEASAALADYELAKQYWEEDNRLLADCEKEIQRLEDRLEFAEYGEDL